MFRIAYAFLALAALVLAPSEVSRHLLRSRVADSMVRTGQAAEFGSYVFDVRDRAWERARLQDQNFAVLDRARQAFRAGEIAEAEKFLRQCPLDGRAQPICGGNEWGAPPGTFATMALMRWEVEEGRFDAALRRVKPIVSVTEFGAGASLAVIMGAFATGGDPARILDVRRLAEAAGDTFDSCILMAPTFIRRAVVRSGATLRKMACEGQVQAALDLARSETDVRLRTRALCVVAEGLAGVPGVWSDDLNFY